MSEVFTNQNICNTFQKVIHLGSDNYLYDGTGSIIDSTIFGSLWEQGNDYIYKDSGSVYVYNEFGENNHSIRVRNESGLQILQEKIVKLNGHITTDNVPTISLISDYTIKPLGILTKNISNNITDFILNRGLLQTTFPTTSATIGDNVYVDNNGNLSLSMTSFPVGYVTDNSGMIYFDFNLSNSFTNTILEGHGPPSGSATLPVQFYIDLDGNDGTNYNLWGWSDSDSDNIWKPFCCPTITLEDKTINSNTINSNTLG